MNTALLITCEITHINYMWNNTHSIQNAAKWQSLRYANFLLGIKIKTASNL